MDLINCPVNNYKEGKAYWYFTCEWVREIRYHPIRASAPCVLQADVHASMSICKKPYKVWVMASKKTQNCAGAEIKAAHCSWTAWLLQPHRQTAFSCEGSCQVWCNPTLHRSRVQLGDFTRYCCQKTA